MKVLSGKHFSHFEDDKVHVFGRWNPKIHALFWKIIAWNPDPTIFSLLYGT
jgi:hypothetical protein